MPESRTVRRVERLARVPKRAVSAARPQTQLRLVLELLHSLELELERAVAASRRGSARVNADCVNQFGSAYVNSDNQLGSAFVNSDKQFGSAQVNSDNQRGSAHVNAVAVDQRGSEFVNAVAVGQIESLRGRAAQQSTRHDTARRTAHSRGSLRVQSTNEAVNTASRQQHQEHVESIAEIRSNCATEIATENAE